MGVNHFLISLNDEQLESALSTPENIRKLINLQEEKVVTLGTDGVAIVSLTASSKTDPLAFIIDGAPDDCSGWVGKNNQEGESEVDMGYGPASFYRSQFIRIVAQELKPLSVEAFTKICYIELLEKNNIYPGSWLDSGRRERLIRSFEIYRAYILETAEQDLNLLVWCA